MTHALRRWQPDRNATSATRIAGEAYVMVGNLARAEEHLAALRQICLLPCDELGDLERELAAYRQNTGTGR